MFVAVPTDIGQVPAPAIRPVANWVLVTVNVLAFAFGASRFWHLGPGQPWWSIFTYGFAHANPWHLIGNMYVLLMVGNPVNRRLGHLYYLFAYLGTLIVLGLIGWTVKSLGDLRGASGAIFSVVAIFLMLMPAALVKFAYVALFPVTVLIGLIKKLDAWIDWFIKWGTFVARAWWLIVIVPLIEVWGLLMWRISLGEWQLNNLAHLLGLLCGIGIVLLLPTRITMGHRLSA